MAIAVTSFRPAKRYWLRGGLIGILVQIIVYIVSYTFILKSLSLGCNLPEHPETILCSDIWQLIASPIFIYHIYHSLLYLIVAMISGQYIVGWVGNVLVIAQIIVCFLISFGIGAIIGTWYAKKIEKRQKISP